MRADRLRALLEDVPDLAEVTVRITVGGDLGTDDVPLDEVKVTSDHAGARVVLIPPDVYNLRELLDNALAASYAIADAEDLGNGFVRWTRDEDGELILDHVDATRVLLLPPPATALGAEAKP